MEKHIRTAQRLFLPVQWPEQWELHTCLQQGTVGSCRGHLRALNPSQGSGGAAVNSGAGALHSLWNSSLLTGFSARISSSFSISLQSALPFTISLQSVGFTIYRIYCRSSSQAGLPRGAPGRWCCACAELPQASIHPDRHWVISLVGVWTYNSHVVQRRLCYTEQR